MNNKPKHFLIFKLIGLAGIALAIGGLIFILTGFGDFESSKFIIGGLMLPFGVIMAALGLTLGFSPEIARISTKSTKYIQQANKEDLTQIVNNAADIMNGAVTKTTKAVKDGLSDSVYCKYCGVKIDADSVFCNKCGKKQ